MAKVWLRKLSDVRDVVRELVLLVGAESEELRGGMTGRPFGRPLESSSRDRAGTESDMVRFLCRGTFTRLEPSDDTGGRRLDR